MAQLVLATYRGMVLAKVARTSRAMTEMERQQVNINTNQYNSSLVG